MKTQAHLIVATVTILYCFRYGGLNYRFLDFSALTVGSTTESLDFATSPLAKYFEGGNVPLEYYVVCDTAYTLSNFVLCPFAGKYVQGYKDAFKKNIFYENPRRAGFWSSYWTLEDLSEWRHKLICTRLRVYCGSGNDPE